MSTPFVAEVRPWACNFAPRGWAFAAGQILPIQQYTAVFALIGVYYGGNGTSNFQLPDLRSRVPIHYGTSPFGTYVIGETGGVEQVTITQTYMPSHTHNVFGTNATSPNYQKPAAGSAIGTDTRNQNFYAPGNTAGLVAINAGTVSPYNGGSQSHTNVQPYQAINWCIALTGIFPPRN
jgi:microcystin-dependent protein